MVPVLGLDPLDVFERIAEVDGHGRGGERKPDSPGRRSADQDRRSPGLDGLDGCSPANLVDSPVDLDDPVGPESVAHGLSHCGDLVPVGTPHDRRLAFAFIEDCEQFVDLGHLAADLGDLAAVVCHPAPCDLVEPQG